ncbi:MAG: hypothetical protein JJU36_04040 [Phycisphaeraceae bacterium]|nr:hypothetical protein [Phycisphaeraceae bacterium]
MAKSLEPKIDWTHRLVALALFLMITVIVILAARDLIFGRGDRPSISAAQLRSVIENFREKRRVRMVDEFGQLREIHSQMAEIRDRWIRDAELTEADLQAIEDVEAEFRAKASIADVQNLPIDEIYAVSRAIEQDLVTMYREFLAARMVGTGQGFHFDEAYEQAAIPRPSRRDLDPDALYVFIASARELDRVEAFKEQITRSVIEMREIIDSSEKLLEFTRKSDTATGDGLTLRFSADDIAMLGYRGPELMPDELDFTLAPDVGHFDAIPGRRLVTGGRIDEWLYVDTWYIIGPFPSDRRRTTLDTRFGPEVNVNLDDVFTGLDGRQLTWDFKQTGFVNPGGQRHAHWKIEPRDVVGYGIYYAFTEIYSDRPRQVWIATATDDYGKLWINDELVWISPTHRKPYNAMENIQLISLEQGQNRVLYRVENAGGTMGFSLMMRLMTGSD